LQQAVPQLAAQVPPQPSLIGVVRQVAGQLGVQQAPLVLQTCPPLLQQVLLQQRVPQLAVHVPVQPSEVAVVRQVAQVGWQPPSVPASLPPSPPPSDPPSPPIGRQ